MARFSLAPRAIRAPVAHDSQEEAHEHEPDRRFRVDPRSADARGVGVGHLVIQPRQIEHAIDAGEDAVVGDEVSERAAHEELELTALLPTWHHQPPTPWRRTRKSGHAGFFDGPRVR